VDGKSFFDVDAALVGCGHVSGLPVRRGWPLARVVRLRAISKRAQGLRAETVIGRRYASTSR
jgi:hypothetical protein